MNVTVHGFNVRNPNETVGKLLKFFKVATMFNYGWFGIFSVLFYNKREAKKLKQKAITGNYWAHSNGCAIAVRAAEMGLEIKTLICINPALKADRVFPKTIKNIIIIYTKHDKPTRTAAFFDKVPFMQILVPNAWGAMGAKGYGGAPDSRIQNWDLSTSLSGHSAFFKDKNLEQFMPELLECIDTQGY